VSEIATSRAPALLTWTAHAAVWLLAGLSARLSRVGSQLEVHITGRGGAEIAPEHLRMILTAPTTEFKLISFLGVVAALVLAMLLLKHGPRGVRWLTLAVAAVCALIYLAGYGFG
jgi:hypothetical protein